MTRKKERRLDNLFSFNRQPLRKDKHDPAEIEEALAPLLRAIEGLAAKVDALIAKGA